MLPVFYTIILLQYKKLSIRRYHRNVVQSRSTRIERYCLIFEFAAGTFLNFNELICSYCNINKFHSNRLKSAILSSFSVSMHKLHLAGKLYLFRIQICNLDGIIGEIVLCIINHLKFKYSSPKICFIINIIVKSK